MIYQKLLIGNKPFEAHITDISSFPVHRHHEIEMLYCLEGSISADINGEKVHISKGEMLYVNSFAPHSYESENTGSVVFVEFGPSFLKDEFLYFTHFAHPFTVKSDKDSEIIRNFEELAHILSDNKANSLDLLSGLYKLAAAVLREIKTESCFSKKRDFDRISGALRLIHMNYSMPLTVEDACRETSLTPGNFCTLFKSAVGVSFHKYLNSYRVSNAGYLLTQTDMSIEEISEVSGFNDIKTFYRVFRNETGTSPKKYRDGK